MQNLVTQIQSHVKIRRNRSLPVSGTVLVRLGQKVTPSEIVAESIVPTRHILVDVYRALGLKSPAEAEKLIARKVGDQLDSHDIVAETGGVLSRVMRTPVPGRVVSVKNGRVLLEVESRKLTVQAGFNGQVVEIIKNRGAVIETNVSLIQGVWGNGQIGFGPFAVDPETIDRELLPSTLSINARGMVITAAFCDSEESLVAAGTLPVAGLILGSMNPGLIACASSQTYPIILLEGFGKTGINEVARNVLLQNAHKEMSLNAVKWDHWYGQRPEITVERTEESEPEISARVLAAGQSVRVHHSIGFGQIGTVTALNSVKTTLPNGLRTNTASILFQNNEKAVLPISNFDIIESNSAALG